MIAGLCFVAQDMSTLITAGDGTFSTRDRQIPFYQGYLYGACCFFVGCAMSIYDLILYAHDDMYFCPDWDKILINEVNKLDTKLFYLSGTMINGDPKLNGHINFSAGENIETFDEVKLLSNLDKLSNYDFQGSTWAPHLIHKKFGIKWVALVRNILLALVLIQI